MSILSISNVTKTFGGLKALTDVSLEIEEGKIHAIIGPNGAGKSTLLNCFVGRLTPDSGTVTLNGHSLIGRTPHHINQLGVSRVFQTPEIYSGQTVLENVLIPAFSHSDGAFRLNIFAALDARASVVESAKATLEDVGLGDMLNQQADALSRGDKRRLELAMCLVQKPKLLLLDEPTAGMSRHDTNMTIELLRKISGRGMTKVVIEHDMHVVFSLADTLSVLAQGQVIASGPPEVVRQDPRVQEAYLGGHSS